MLYTQWIITTSHVFLTVPVPKTLSIASQHVLVLVGSSVWVTDGVFLLCTHLQVPRLGQPGSTLLMVRWPDLTAEKSATVCCPLPLDTPALRSRSFPVLLSFPHCVLCLVCALLKPMCFPTHIQEAGTVSLSSWVFGFSLTWASLSRHARLLPFQSMMTLLSHQLPLVHDIKFFSSHKGY